MKIRLSLAALPLLLAACTAVPAQVPEGPDWRLAAESKTMWVYYNKARIVRPPRRPLRVWVQYVNSQTQKKETLNLYEYNCATDMSRTLSQVKYGSDGQVLRSVNPRAPQWEYIAPDSLGEAVLKIVCKGGKDLEQEMDETMAAFYLEGQAAERAGRLESALAAYESALYYAPDSESLLKAVARVKAALAKREKN